MDPDRVIRQDPDLIYRVAEKLCRIATEVTGVKFHARIKWHKRKRPLVRLFPERYKGCVHRSDECDWKKTFPLGYIVFRSTGLDDCIGFMNDTRLDNDKAEQLYDALKNWSEEFFRCGWEEQT